jgi:hypothetical protein
MAHEPIILDLTASFTDVASPTPFGIYDSDPPFQVEADGMVKLVNGKLGGNVLQVEITNRDVYACFEQAVLEYSGMINSYHAKSIMADILGAETGSLETKEQKFARMSLALAKRRADAYSSEALVGGTKPLLSASINLVTGQQNYDLKTLLSASGEIAAGERFEIREMFHFSPTAAFRFFDTTSAINFLHNQFQFESFTPETIFYLLPIWEDVLRAMQLEQSHKIRRSNYSFNIVNNVLRLYPIPTRDIRLHFTYYKVGGSEDDPFDSSSDPLVDGISNLNNVPFGNIDYSKINSIGRQWIRRFALALAKEVLGLVRGKVQTIPIPNGDLALNGPDLVAGAREEMLNLKEELKALLDTMTYSALAQQEADQADNLMRQLAKVPLGIFVG